jgi:Flp pilus assembly protein TadG
MSGQTPASQEVSKPRRQGLIRRFRRDERGVAAIEFSILAMPFLLLVFAILESTISFSAQQLMADTVDDLARDIRVGNVLTADATPAAIRSRICGELETFVETGCPDLLIDLKPYTDYADIPTTLPLKADHDVNTAGFTTSVGGGDTIHMLRIFYRWKFYTKFIGDKLSSLPDGKTLLYAAAAWRNEAYEMN